MPVAAAMPTVEQRHRHQQQRQSRMEFVDDAPRRWAGHASLRPNGRLHWPSVSDTDRTLSVFIHISPFFSLLGAFPWALLVSLVIWLARKDRSAFCDDHGREFMNFAISFMLLHLLLGITLIGLLAWPVLWVVAVISVIRAAVAAGRGEYFRYPMTFRFL